MAGVDFSLVRDEIKDAARQAFEAVRANHPGEQFYTFALYSDESAMTIVPAANSEEALQRQVRADGSSAPAWLRWSTGEWAYEGEGSEHFDSVSRRINVDERYEESEPGAFEAFRDNVYAAMVQALGDLDAEGFFGEGEAREAVTLFCSVTDADENLEQLDNESARQLNPAAVYEKFAAR
jgi:hypothetical protein